VDTEEPEAARVEPMVSRIQVRVAAWPKALSTLLLVDVDVEADGGQIPGGEDERDVEGIHQGFLGRVTL
jgi:hypothetical protein